MKIPISRGHKMSNLQGRWQHTYLSLNVMQVRTCPTAEAMTWERVYVLSEVCSVQIHF